MNSERDSTGPFVARRLAGLLQSSLLGLFVLLADLTTADAAETDAAEAIKTFSGATNRVVAFTFVYTDQRMAQSTNNLLRQGARKLVRGMWSNRGLAQQTWSVPPEGDAVPGDLANSTTVIRRDNAFWFHAPRSDRHIYYEGRITEPVDRDNPALLAYDFALIDLSPLLNMGVQLARPGTIQWEGDAFHARTILPETRVILHGELVREAGLQPTALLVEQTTNTRITRWRTVYGYSRSLECPTMPSTLNLEWEGDDKTNRPHSAYEILSLRGVSQADFDTHTERLAQELGATVPRALYKDRQLFEMLPGGELLPLLPNGKSARRPTQWNSPRLAFLTGVSAILAGFLAFCRGLTKPIAENKAKMLCN